MSEFNEAESMVQSEPTAILVENKIGDREYFDHVKKVNDTFYDQIKAADQKAAYIFTFLLAFMISSTEGRQVFRFSQYSSGNVIQIIASALLAAALVYSMISAIMVVLPRVRTTATSLFWGAWHTNSLEVRAAHDRMDQDFLFNEYMENATNLSLIAKAKYRFVGQAFRSLIVAVLAYVLLLVAAAN